MPIFEYLCLTCAASFEKLQKAGCEDRPECPACGSLDVKKEFSTFSAQGASSPAAGCSGGG